MVSLYIDIPRTLIYIQTSLEESHLNTYRNLFKLQPDLLKIAQRLPANVKYMGHEIQKDVISVLAKMLKKVVAERMSESKLFIIMIDGSTDKKGRGHWVDIMLHS